MTDQTGNPRIKLSPRKPETSRARSSFAWRGMVLAAVLAPATLLVSAADVACAAEPAAASPADVKKATDAFKSGTTLLGQKKFGLALEQFKQSYGLVPSPNSALYIARCYVEMGQNKDAYHQFLRVIDEANARVDKEPKYAPTRDSAKAELDEVSKRLGVVSLNVKDAPADAIVKVAGVSIPQGEWSRPIPVDPGSLTVSLTPAVGTPTEKTIQVAAGDRPTIDLELTRADEKPIAEVPNEPSSKPTFLLPLAISFGGVGVVGMGLFGVAGGMSLGTYSELEDACGANPCPASQTGTIDRGQREQTLANVGAIVGGIGLAAGATLFVVYLATDSGSESKSEAPPVTVSVSPTGASATVSF